ncbi:MAG: cytochrome o ubiquinol oxidase subunit IV [Buchnera aphidicola (Periphyllus aceris)]|nr:cytochrome o ubiquinol oxidase subunit IV [Buchnera aphidicola (Periphyllus aceris)]
MNFHNKFLSFLKTTIFFYIMIFFLSLVLSFFPFFIVSYHIFSKNILYFLIIICCFFQILLHILFYLHLNDLNKNSWNFFSIIFTFTIITIIFSGSVWIMRNLNHHVISI